MWRARVVVRAEVLSPLSPVEAGNEPHKQHALSRGVARPTTLQENRRAAVSLAALRALRSLRVPHVEWDAVMTPPLRIAELEITDENSLVFLRVPIAIAMERTRSPLLLASLSSL